MTAFTQADIDAAEKRGRAIGTANASRRFSESLPEAIRQQREIAWAEGVRVALNFAKRNPDGVTLRLEKPNPYATTKETTP